MAREEILVQDRVFSGEETRQMEFKAHDRLSSSQVTADETDRKLFQPASRTICAFLNINEECDLFLGIMDSGKVKGHYMFAAQKDHFEQNLRLLMKKQFSPPVDDYRYSVNFVGVQTEHETFKGNDVVPNKSHKLLDVPGHCWCEQDIRRAKRENTKKPPLYVIQVKIHKWDPKRESDPAHNVIWPYYTNEDGKCYKRHQASNHEVMQDTLSEETTIDVTRFYGKKGS
eukprot:sb/3469530/